MTQTERFLKFIQVYKQRADEEEQVCLRIDEGILVITRRLAFQNSPPHLTGRNEVIAAPIP